MDDIFVGRLMSSPVETVTADTPLDVVAGEMIDSHIGSVVVVDDDGGLVGIITATDFVRLAAKNDSAADSVVADYMTTDVVTATANDSIRDVADTILEHGFHHMPVVDDEAGVIGIVTTTDLTAYLSHIETPSPEK